MGKDTQPARIKLYNLAEKAKQDFENFNAYPIHVPF